MFSKTWKYDISSNTLNTLLTKTYLAAGGVRGSNPLASDFGGLFYRKFGHSKVSDIPLGDRLEALHTGLAFFSGNYTRKQLLEDSFYKRKKGSKQP